MEEVVCAVKVITSFELQTRPRFHHTGAAVHQPPGRSHVHKMGDQYTIVLNDDGLSKLRISDHYRRALKNGEGKVTKDYIQDKLRSAVWLIRINPSGRQRTIFKVTLSRL